MERGRSASNPPIVVTRPNDPTDQALVSDACGCPRAWPQHLQTFRADGDVTVAGKWGAVEVKKGKPWSTTDAVFIDTHGREVALVRQVAVILPRLPET